MGEINRTEKWLARQKVNCRRDGDKFRDAFLCVFLVLDARPEPDIRPRIRIWLSFGIHVLRRNGPTIPWMSPVMVLAFPYVFGPPLHATEEACLRQMLRDPLRTLRQYLIDVLWRLPDDFPRIVPPYVGFLDEEIREGACEDPSRFLPS